MKKFSFLFVMAVAYVTSSTSGGVRAADVSDQPIRFYADLSPDEETATTVSNGKGRVDFMLDRKTLKLSWKLTYSGLSSEPINAFVHGPQRVGVNGMRLYNLAPNGMRSPTEGSVMMTEGELQYLLVRHLYVNLCTAKYKDGELRGHIEKMPPPEMQ